MVDIPGEKIAEQVADGVTKNAMNPTWVIGFLLIAAFLFIGAIFVGGFVYIVKPNADAQNEAVRASITAIESNAESNKRMGTAIEKMSTAVESINVRFKDQAETMKDIANALGKPKPGG